MSTDGFGSSNAPYPYATNTCPVDASAADMAGLFNSWQANEIAQQIAWSDAYAQAAEKARQSAFEQAAIQLAIAGVQFAATQYMADKQYEIADRQMNIAEEEHQRYKDYFWCVENLMADEACAEDIYQPDIVTRSNRAVIEGRRIFGIKHKELARNRKRYCAADFVRDQCDMYALEAKSIADLKERAVRVEEMREDAFSDRRYNRQLAVSHFGRNLQSGYVALSSQATQYALGAMQTEMAGINNFLGTLSGSLMGANQARFSAPVSFAPQSGSGGQAPAAIPVPTTRPYWRPYDPYTQGTPGMYEETL